MPLTGTVFQRYSILIRKPNSPALIVPAYDESPASGSRWIGRGWVDNTSIKRLWRFLKCGCVHLREIETGSELRKGLKVQVIFL